MCRLAGEPGGPPARRGRGGRAEQNGGDCQRRRRREPTDMSKTRKTQMFVYAQTVHPMPLSLS